MKLLEQTLKLNLGGRGTHIPGFTTVDLSEENTDGIKADVSDLSMIETGSVSEIYASQILEHFPHVKTDAVLAEWFRVLAKGGKLIVGVPDFERAIELYKSHGLTAWVVNFLYGDQGYDLAYHYAPFTFARLAGLLSKAGFSDVKRIADMPHGLSDCSSLISTVDSKRVSLNVEAIK